MKIVPTESKHLKNSFYELDSALDGLRPHISENRTSLYAILAAILHLGNVDFKTNDLGFAQINDVDDSQESLECAANLLAIDVKELERVLLERKIILPNNREEMVAYVQSTRIALSFLLYYFYQENIKFYCFPFAEYNLIEFWPCERETQR